MTVREASFGELHAFINLHYQRKCVYSYHLTLFLHSADDADLEWKLTYVGSAESEKYDQTLDAVYVGPVALGQYRFVFQADPPDFSKIPPDDVVGVTIILLTCSYRNQEFLRVGYYVNNEYEDEELRIEPPPQPQIEK